MLFVIYVILELGLGSRTVLRLQNEESQILSQISYTKTAAGLKS